METMNTPAKRTREVNILVRMSRRHTEIQKESPAGLLKDRDMAEAVLSQIYSTHAISKECSLYIQNNNNKKLLWSWFGMGRRSTSQHAGFNVRPAVESADQLPHCIYMKWTLDNLLKKVPVIKMKHDMLKHIISHGGESLSNMT